MEGYNLKEPVSVQVAARRPVLYDVSDTGGRGVELMRAFCGLFLSLL